uniref:Uncharacterized protein n=1 Tax=Meloidogyne enterolobii TaxID=390850 RepID=A0A6V7U186_MELEN|nr:unnamed protein product [Meloidogyne enterolobii]
MKINFKTYFLYMFSTVLIVGMLYDLICIFYAVQYIVGGIKQFDQDLLNKTFPYFIMKVEGFSSLIFSLFIIIPYIIIFICGFKMVYYVNSHTGFDQNLKRLLRQLTKTLIILTIIPSVNQFFILLIIFFTFNNDTDDTTNVNHMNLVAIFYGIFTHFIPVFNPIVCIITNKPYREAVYNRLRIHPQVANQN